VIVGKAVGAWQLLADRCNTEVDQDLALLLRSDNLFPTVVLGNAPAVQ